MRGHLLIAGGNIGAAEAGRRAVFGRFAELCGGEEGRVLIVPCASGDPEDSAAYITEELLEAGVGECCTLPLTEKEDLLARGWTNRADDGLVPLLDDRTGVWFTGGDQLRTARLLLEQDGSDTPVLRAIRTVLARGGVIGGTSAGAAIMGKSMIVRGDEEGALNLPVSTDFHSYVDREETPEPLLVGPGLGFLPRGITDQHFNRRPRLQRLLKAMEVSGEEKGFGVSEDTALEADLAEGTLRVWGSAYVLCAVQRGGETVLTKLTAADEAVPY